MSVVSVFTALVSGVVGLLAASVMTQVMRRGHLGDVSVRWPWLALASALTFAIMPALVPAVALPAYLALAAAGVGLAAIDLATRRLPNALTYPTAGVVGIWLVGISLVCGQPAQSWRTLGAGAAAGLAFGLLHVVNPRGMGLGDVKLALPLGFALGWVSWPTLLAGGLLTFGLAASVGVALIATGQATRRSALPFGPFMLAGTLLALAGGDDLGRWFIATW